MQHIICFDVRGHVFQFERLLLLPWLALLYRGGRNHRRRFSSTGNVRVRKTFDVIHVVRNGNTIDAGTDGRHDAAANATTKLKLTGGISWLSSRGNLAHVMGIELSPTDDELRNRAGIFFPQSLIRNDVNLLVFLQFLLVAQKSRNRIWVLIHWRKLPNHCRNIRNRVLQLAAH